jgi:hypothetical protein
LSNELSNELSVESNANQMKSHFNGINTDININDNYFMGQSLRSKTSDNIFSKVMENFDLNEKQIKDIIDKQLITETKHLTHFYIQIENYFQKWIHLLRYSFNGIIYYINYILITYLLYLNTNQLWFQCIALWHWI